MKRYDITDNLTGKTIEDVTPYLVKKKIRVPKEVLMLSQQEILKLISMRDEKERPVLQGNDLRVLLTLLGHLDFENYIGINQNKLAQFLGMNRSSVSRSLKKIKDLNILEEEDKEEIHSYFRLNPEFCWKGKGETWMIELKKRQMNRKTAIDKFKEEQEIDYDDFENIEDYEE